jgi:uncharacterized protein YndB with AHSA1/START domain
MAARNNTVSVTLPSDREIRMTRTFDAPSRLVFEAWTTPAYVKRWFGCDEYPMSVCEIDLRLGGSYTYTNRGPDGTEFSFVGRYQEIVRTERLVYTQRFIAPAFTSPEAIVTDLFEEKDGKTTMISTVLHATKESRDGHLQSGVEKGAGEALDRLEDIVRSMM